MSNFEQSVIERDESAPGLMTAWGAELLVLLSGKPGAADDEQAAERAARASLKAQLARLEQERSATGSDQIQAVVTDVAGRIQAKFGPASKTYFAAKRIVGTLYHRGELDEEKIFEFAYSLKFDETAFALSLPVTASRARLS